MPKQLYDELLTQASLEGVNLNSYVNLLLTVGVAQGRILDKLWDENLRLLQAEERVRGEDPLTTFARELIALKDDPQKRGVITLTQIIHQAKEALRMRERDRAIANCWAAYARAHFGLDGSEPTESEAKGMEAAIREYRKDFPQAAWDTLCRELAALAVVYKIPDDDPMFERASDALQRLRGRHPIITVTDEMVNAVRAAIAETPPYTSVSHGQLQAALQAVLDA